MYFCYDNLNKIIVAFNIITLPVVILFIASGFGQLIYAIKLQRKFPEEHNFNNSILKMSLNICSQILLFANLL